MASAFLPGVWLRLGVCLVVAVLCIGCRTGQLPDPNDPGASGLMPAAVLRRNLEYANRMLEHRQELGEITPEQRKELLKRYANDQIEKIDLGKIPERQAWEYGMVFITAERWDLAKNMFEIAVKDPKSEDRRVNDVLRLARCEANLGDVPRAIELARSTFDVDDRGTAPILPAVLLEIVPAAQGKGHDGGLAALLVDAIQQHRRTIVDAKSDSGRAYMLAKPIHIRDAYILAIRLYERAGMTEEAAKTREEFRQAMTEFGRA